MDTSNLRERCEKHGVIWDVNQRWESGIDHHQEAVAMFRLISDSDFAFCDDYFCWKSGGDGDNGEALMFSLSALLELRDAEGGDQ